jgi:hypothetical protein
LNANAQQDKCDYAQDAMRSRGRNDLGDLWCVRIAKVNEYAKDDNGKKDADMSKNIV